MGENSTVATLPRQANSSVCSLQRSASQRRLRTHAVCRENDQFALTRICLFHRRSHLKKENICRKLLEILSGIKSPMYGVPGNHDYWSKAPFNGMIQCFAATGGAWLLDEEEQLLMGRSILLELHTLVPNILCLPQSQE